MLLHANQALDTINKNDISELKGMKSPPSAIRLVMEALCIMRGIKPTRMKDATSGRVSDGCRILLGTLENIWDTYSPLIFVTNY